MNTSRATSCSQTGPHRRVRLPYAGESVDDNDHSIPAPAYTDASLRRTRSSMPARIIRHLTNRHEARYDSNTVPLLSKREQRKTEKREQRKLEALQAYQRKQFHDQISRQLDVNQGEREPQPQIQPRRSVTQRVKDTLRKSRKGGRKQNGIQLSTMGSQSALPTRSPPRVDDFLHKDDLRQWFHGPSDVEAAFAPAVTIEEPPAELDATGTPSPYPSFTGAVSKRHFNPSIDLETLSPPIRSPSPCLPTLPQRGMTVNETPAQLPGKQMQCDSCHDAIKMTGFHYVCTLCNEGDCLYCAKCANGGRTCRHELIERTRNIKRHATNPRPVSRIERKMFVPDRDSVVSSDAHIELSATHSRSILSSLDTQAPQTPLEELASSSRAQRKSHPASPESPISPVDLLKDFEAKRREQEVAFREKEVTLREREAMLREREALTASRERDAALVQQLHAAAMLQQRAEVGAQFSPHSSLARRSPYGGSVSRHPSSRSEFSRSHSYSQSDPDFLFNRSTEESTEDVTLHPSAKGKRPNAELISSISAIEASIAGVKITEGGIRTHANSTKRKALPENKHHSSSSSSRKTSGASRRATSTREDTDEKDEDDDDDDSGSPKRQKQEAYDQCEPKKLFACPYYKHNPIRYGERNTEELSYRSCATGLFRDISRVKQHLKRTHHRPDFYCRRCFATFSTSELLQKHSSSPRGCAVQDCPYPERLEETQQARIHVKKPGKDPKELWNEIFSIIFPDSPVPESPYIGQAQSSNGGVLPNLLEQFIDGFNRRLTCASHSSQSWLGSPSAREFLNTQMLQTMQDVMRSQASHGNASPTSAPTEYHDPSRHTSSSSRASSSLHQHARQPQYLSPVSAQPGLRPALKVATTMPRGTSSDSGESVTNSANSQRSHSFPRVPRHVWEDPGYDNGSSWASGDDVYIMGATVNSNAEPSSATSTRSTKSVSFVTPPEQMANCQVPKNMSGTATFVEFERDPGPDLFDIASIDWSAQNSAAGIYGKQSSLGKQPYPRADSAYGTLSPAQASQTSLFQPQPYVHVPQEQLTCVDPSKLFVNSADANLGGLSVDVQAYFNRDVHGYFGA